MSEDSYSKDEQEAEVAWKLTTNKKNLTCESNFWIDFGTMNNYYGDNTIAK